MRRAFVAAIVAVLGISCADVDNGGPVSGSTQVLLTDAPFPYGDIAKVEVFINSVDASTDVDTSNGVQNWTPIAAPNAVFDLLTLQRGTTALLGDADLPAGSYRAIRMTIDPAQSRVTRKNGTQATVQWPQVAGGLIVMHALVEEPLATGPGNRIVIDFDVGRSFLVVDGFSTDFVFSPWLRAVNENATGDLYGEVFWTNSIEGSAGFGGNSGPLANATVTVYRGNPAHEGSWWVAATGTTDAAGKYRIAFLRDAEYIVRFAGVTPEGYGCSQFTEIAVQVQASKELNAAVFPLDGCVAPDPDPNDTTRTDTTIVTPGGPVEHVNVRSWGGLSFQVGDSIGVMAELTNAQGSLLSGRQVSWMPSDFSAFQMQIFGQHLLLRPLKPGTFTITATSEGRTGSITLTIAAAPPPSGPVAGIRFSPHVTSGRVGDTIGVNAYPINAQGQQLPGIIEAWSVSDPTVLVLTHMTPYYAVVRGLKVGTAQIIARSDTVSRGFTLTIRTDSAVAGGGGPVANVSVQSWPASPVVNDSISAFATLTNAAGQTLTARTVTWTSSDPTVVQITGQFSQSMVGKALKAGTVTLTATSEGKTGTKVITIQ